MTTLSPHDVTRLLIQLTDGNKTVLDELLPLVYGELRSLAANYLRRERSSHTLQPTALVHEAYLRLVDQNQVKWQNRAHFFGVAAQMMRRILVDHARGHNADKCGGEVHKVSLDEAIEQCRKALAIDPGAVSAHVVLRWAYEKKGMHKEAFAIYEKERAFAGDTPTTRAKLAHVLAASGRGDEARRMCCKNSWRAASSNG